jgi:hypothetical protein
MPDGRTRRVLTTVAVFAVVGPPIGGLVIGVYPLGILLATGFATALRQGGAPGSLLDLLARMGWLVALIAAQSYVFAGVPAIMAGVGLATLIGWRGGYGVRQCLSVSVGALVIWNGVVAVWGAASLDAAIPAVLYPVIVQSIPAVIAALVCRWLAGALGGAENETDASSPQHDLAP